MHTQRWIILGGLFVGGFLAIYLIVYFGQRKLMYFPQVMKEAEALQTAKAMGMEAWKAQDGNLLGWRARHPSGKPAGRLLIVHGNAGCALDRGYLVRVFQSPKVEIPLDVIVMEYPGFGSRSGVLSESSFLDAGTKALALLKEESPLPILVLGESIGSGVAAQLAFSKDVSGLILVTPYTSFKDVARYHYPIFPAFMLKDTYVSDEALKVFKGPVAFLVAGRDEVVPSRLGLALHEGYAGPKRLWIETLAGHNTINYAPERPIWNEIVAFTCRP